MGPANQKPQPPKYDEAKILADAGKLTSELSLYNNETQRKDQHILFARIMIYGHEHLLSHLKSFQNQKRRKKFLQYLHSTDYQTIDLLYQNIVCKKQKNSKNTQTFVEYSRIQNRQSQNSKVFKEYTQIGEKLLKNKKATFMIFAGGSSSRFTDKEGNILKKQSFTEKKQQKCLLQIFLDRIKEASLKYGKIQTFIVYNKSIEDQLDSLIIKKYSQLNIKKLEQHFRDIVNLSGKLCLQNQNSYQLLKAPSGCGDFVKLMSERKGKKLLDSLQSEGTQYLCCIGAENIFEKVVDPYFLGKIDKQELGGVYKCTYPENEKESLNRIVQDYNSGKIIIDQLQNLQQNCDQNSKTIVRRSPVWMNSTIFNVSKLIKSLAATEINQKNQNYLINLTSKKKKVTYWNAEQKLYCEDQYCFVFERQLSDIMINGNLVSKGINVERQEQFMPVISLEQQNIWQQAYRLYEQKEQKRQKLLRMENQSVVSKFQDIE